jgi:site-specific DNA recombinase
VRYRYYVSHALLQGEKAASGAVARVSAPEIESRVLDAIRASGSIDPQEMDRDVIDARLIRATLRTDSIDITLKPADVDPSQPIEPIRISIAFSLSTLPRKGVAYAPKGDSPTQTANRQALLFSIARARAWIDSVTTTPTTDFATIAARGNLSERYVRLLAPLAFLSPRIVEALAHDPLPAGLTPTSLARNLPLSWAEQELRFGLS